MPRRERAGLLQPADEAPQVSVGGTPRSRSTTMSNGREQQLRLTSCELQFTLLK